MPSYRPVELPTSVRVRPNKRVIETERSIDTRGEHFDERARADPRMSRVRMRSAEVPYKSVHMVGVVSDGQLHLTPLQAAHLMRPDLRHLDPAEVRPAKADSVQPVKVQAQFRRRDATERADAYRRSSYAYHVAQEEADAMVAVKPHSSASALSLEVFDQLTGRDGTNAGQQDALDDDDIVQPQEFLSASCGAVPSRDSGAVSAAAHSRGSLSLASLSRLPAAVQVEEVLRRAHVLPFMRILSYAASAADVAEVANICNALCRVVRGNLVLRSDVLLLPGWQERLGLIAPAGSRRGTQPARLPRASYVRPLLPARTAALRDCLLALFMQDPVIDVEAAAETLGVRVAAVLPWVQQLATREGGKDSSLWRFGAADDSTFERALPEHADAQAKRMKARAVEARRVLGVEGATAETKHEADLSLTALLELDNVTEALLKGPIATQQQQS